MTTHEIIKALGGPTKVAEMCDPPVTPQAVSQWVEIPTQHLRAIERATGGEWTPKMLRNDLADLFCVQ